jgi:PREDICTED: similar to latrophilin-like protein AD
MIPKKVVNIFSKKGLTRIAFVVYKKLNSLLDPVADSKTKKAITPIVNTDIVGVIVPKHPSLLTSFSQPLKFTFRHLIVENVSDPKCVYWNSSQWSSLGCKLIFTNSSHTECECNHLTNFAVLMNFNQQVILAFF